MTEASVITLIFYLSGDDPHMCCAVEISPSARIVQLMMEFSRVYQMYFGRELGHCNLFKVQVGRKELDKFVLPKDVEPLNFVTRVEQHWPGNQSEKIVNVFAILRPPKAPANELPRGTAGSAPSSTELANSKFIRGMTEQNGKIPHTVKHLPKHPSSSLAHHSRFSQLPNTQHAIFNGWPAHAPGFPVALYHPVFDAFMNRLDSTTELPPSAYTDANHLLETLQAIYSKELHSGGQTDSLRPILEKLLHYSIRTCEGSGTKSDGYISARNGALCMIMDVKNEVGANGPDPTVQGATWYAKYWGERQIMWLRDQSCCPSFILAIAGPWMCILGAVMLNRPVIQPLTSFDWVANSTQSASKTNQVARVFFPLSAALSELQAFYGGLPPASMNPRPHQPYLRHYLEHGAIVNFQYLGGPEPTKTVFLASIVSDDQPKKIGVAPRQIIVKYVESYHVDAHRLLADVGLAPKLNFVSSEGDRGFKVGGLTMIVMEVVPGKDLAELNSVPECVATDVCRALEILHANDIVFGDLRRPNVMAIQDEKGNVTGGMLIDFDWCGKDGEAKYPPDINMKINWPEGVGPGAIMRKEHDWEMFARLLWG